MVSDIGPDGAPLSVHPERTKRFARRFCRNGYFYIRYLRNFVRNLTSKTARSTLTLPSTTMVNRFILYVNCFMKLSIQSNDVGTRESTADWVGYMRILRWTNNNQRWTMLLSILAQLLWKRYNKFESPTFESVSAFNHVLAEAMT
jgi:hypothetical protein